MTKLGISTKYAPVITVIYHFILDYSPSWRPVTARDPSKLRVEVLTYFGPELSFPQGLGSRDAHSLGSRDAHSLGSRDAINL